MIERILAFAACAALAAAPCAAADLHEDERIGARRSGATLASYVKLPLGGAPAKAVRAQAGLRISSMHSYRDSTAPNGREFRSDGLDLRLIGADKPALLVGGRAVTGSNAKSGIVQSDNDTIMALYIGAVVIGIAILVVALKPCVSCGDE